MGKSLTRIEVASGVGVAVLTLWFLASHDSNDVGKYSLDGDTMGCQRQEDFDRLISYSNDQVAWAKIYGSMAAIGACRVLPKGSDVVLIETGRMGVAKIHLRGDTSEFWIASGHLH